MKQLGIRFTNIEEEKPIIIKPNPELKKWFDDQHGGGKHVNQYLADYLGGNPLFSAVQKKYKDYINQSIPEKTKKKCMWHGCIGGGHSKNEMDKKCTMYFHEGDLNHLIAANEFVRITQANKHLIRGDKVLKSLTIQFYECFSFYDGRVVFAMEKMVMHCLHQGFLTLSQLFSKNKPLQNLNIINDNIYELKSNQLEFEMFNNEKNSIIDIQLKFYKKEREFYKHKDVIIKRELKIEPRNESKVKNHPKNPYPSIFKDAQSFQLFDLLYNDYKNSNSLLADFSFIYRMMHKHSYINLQIKPEMFKLWLSKEPFGIVLDNGLKTLDRCTTKNKTINYNTKIDIVIKTTKT